MLKFLLSPFLLLLLLLLIFFFAAVAIAALSRWQPEALVIQEIQKKSPHTMQEYRQL